MLPTEAMPNQKPKPYLVRTSLPNSFGGHVSNPLTLGGIFSHWIPPPPPFHHPTRIHQMEMREFIDLAPPRYARTSENLRVFIFISPHSNRSIFETHSPLPTGYFKTPSNESTTPGKRLEVLWSIWGTPPPLLPDHCSPASNRVDMIVLA